MSRNIITVSGIAGSGKSSLLKSLGDEAHCYIENVEGNPYLRSTFLEAEVLESVAYLNQLWFLRQQQEFIRSDSSRFSTTLIDQDPYLIVHGYGQLLLSEGRMTHAEFANLTNRAARLEEALKVGCESYVRIWLKLPAEISYARIQARDGDRIAMDLTWLKGVELQFTRTLERFEDVVVVDAAATPREEIVSYVRAML